MKAPSEAERTIEFPMHEFLAMIETYLVPDHPIYRYVFRNFQQQILERFGLSDD